MKDIVRLKMIAAELATIAYELEVTRKKLAGRPRLILMKGQQTLDLRNGHKAAFGGEAPEKCQ